MIKTITNTTFTLAAISVLNFLLITLVLRTLGRVGTADMGLIVLGISFILMISNIIGGSSLVYFTSRESNFTLLIISYLWAVFSTVLMGTILYIFQLVPMEFVWFVIFIGFFECIFSIHNQLFIGRQDMRNHNFLKLVQKVIQLGIFVLMEITINNFVISLLISYLIILIFSFTKTYKSLTDFSLENSRLLFKKAFKYGFQIQSSNIVQLLNYRLLYFFIEKTMGKSVLGLFTIAVQLSESLWIPSKALSIIQYGKVSNERIEKNKTVISIQFMKLSFVITIVLTSILLLLPYPFLVGIFKEGILGVKPVILSLSVGILSIAMALSFSHYLSGKGLYHYLIKGAVVGLVTLLISGWILIDYYGLIGAGLATSFSYLASSIYLGRIFMQESQTSLKDFIIKKSEVTSLISLLKRN